MYALLCKGCGLPKLSLIAMVTKNTVKWALLSSSCISHRSSYVFNVCRVKEFEVLDIFPFGVSFTWDKDGETTTTNLFERGGVIPSAKMLTFYRWVVPRYALRSITEMCSIEGSQESLQLVKRGSLLLARYGTDWWRQKRLCPPPPFLFWGLP